MNRTLLLLMFVVLLPLSFCCEPVGAQNKTQDHSATFPPVNDPDFGLMGEYVGKIQEKKKKSTIAVQLRYLGSQEFEGLLFWRGLPGQKNMGKKSTRLVGRRAGDSVILSGGRWAIFVEEDQCEVVTKQGENIGTLKRVTRMSPTMHAPAPKQGQVIFDGANTASFSNGRISPDGYLMEGAKWKPMFQDFDMHLEFKLPWVPDRRGQNRGNSGIYMQGRYELQVLDSFATVSQFNTGGAFYRQQVPRLNMCFPPLQWQTYDIRFTAPRWDADGNKIRNAVATVWHNGVKIHDNYELKSKTGAGKPEGNELLPHFFQDHGNSVRYRNVWIVDRGLAHVKFPVFPTKQQVGQTLARAKEIQMQRDAAQQKLEKDQALGEPKPGDAVQPDAATENDSKKNSVPAPTNDQKGSSESSGK